jgi:ATP synthase F1 delta subunit
VLRTVATEYAGDLLSSVAELTELATHIAGLDAETIRVEEPIHGLTSWRNFASGYAAAILEHLGAKEIEQVEEELFRFTRIVESSPSLRSTLANSTRSVEGRQDVISDLLDGKVLPATVRLARVTLQGRVRDLVASLDWLVQLVAQMRGWRIAKVHTAAEMDGPSQQRLSAALAEFAGAPVELQVKLDTSLIGGVLVEIGDLLVDASIAQRIEQLREHLLDTEGSQQQAKDHD